MRTISLRYTINPKVEHELVWQWLDAYNTMMILRGDRKGFSSAYAEHRRTTQALASHYGMEPREVARTLLPLWAGAGDGVSGVDMDRFIVQLHNLAGWCRDLKDALKAGPVGDVRVQAQISYRAGRAA